MRVTVLTEYTGLWVQQPREVQPRNAIRSAPQTRVPSNVPQAVERLGAPEFSKDELTRLKEFMTKIGEKVDSIDGVIRDFERIDTTRKGTITAEQVIAFERSSSEQAVPAQPLMLDQTEAISPLAKAPMESYLNKYTVEPEQKTSTFERSE